MSQPTPPQLHQSARPRDFVVEPGLTLRAGGAIVRIHAINGQLVTLEHTVSLDRKVIELQRLLVAITGGEVVVADPDTVQDGEDRALLDVPLNDLTPAKRDHVRRLLRYITELRKLGYQHLTPKHPTIQLDLNRLREKYADPKPVKAAWVYKWSLAYDRAGGDPRALIPAFDRRGRPGGGRLDPRVEDALDRAIEERRRTPGKTVRPSEIRDRAKQILQIEHPESPDLIIGLNWSSADRRVKRAFTAYERCARNHGREFAKTTYRHWYPRDKAEFVLEVLETDDTDTETFLIDDRSGLPWGRAYLTAVTDQCTTGPHGLDLSEQPRSLSSAISSLVHAMLPKDPDHPDFAQCSAGCEFYGKPGVIVFDNALYNHAAQIELFAHDVGVQPAWAKPKTPTEKSRQEGFFGLMKQAFLSGLPGYRGSKKRREGLQDGVQTANLSLLEFRQALVKWFYDDYVNTPQADGWTPRQRWQAGMRYAKPRLPRDIQGLRLQSCIQATIRLRPEGIRYAGIIYSAPQLAIYAKKYGATAPITYRRNPRDLGTIYAFDPDLKCYWPVPAVDQAYANGLTDYQHRLIRKLARDAGRRNPAIPDLLRYREELRILTEQLRFSKKLRDRKRAARTGDLSSSPAVDAAPSTGEGDQSPITDLEARIQDIESVDMELDDEGWALPIDF